MACGWWALASGERVAGPTSGRLDSAERRPASGPRRPASPAGAAARAPGRGENRPAPSLVISTESSTVMRRPDMGLRLDDLGRGFLYAVMRRPGVGVPPAHTGARWSRELTPRAARQIKGAALKADAQRTPLKTFITFTVRLQDRRAFLSGELVLGREIRPTIDELKEWLRRRGLRGRLVWVPETRATRIRTCTCSPAMKCLDLSSRHSLCTSNPCGALGLPRSSGYIVQSAPVTTCSKHSGTPFKGADGKQGAVKGNRYGISRQIMPRYQTFELSQCGGAVETLRWMQDGMGDGDIEEIGEGLYLTKWGLSSRAGTDLGEALRIVIALNRPDNSRGGSEGRCAR